MNIGFAAVVEPAGQVVANEDEFESWLIAVIVVVGVLLIAGVALGLLATFNPSFRRKLMPFN